MNNWIKEAAIVSLGLIVMGLSLRGGIIAFKSMDRVVTVKGLAEMEVPANKATWTLSFKEVGNDLQLLYRGINKKNETVISYLKTQGLTEDEIALNAPIMDDKEANDYYNAQNKYRYHATSVITVTSTKVDLIRNLLSRQSELLQQGVMLVGDSYSQPVDFDYTSLNEIKPAMIEEATKNARAAAEKFAADSGSKLGNIKSARQGQFSIENRDENTSYIKRVRVVTTIDYYLKD